MDSLFYDRLTDWPSIVTQDIQDWGSIYLVVWEPPFREDLSPDAEEYPLLEAVTRKYLQTDWEQQNLRSSEL
jgi:hypothetical protein